MKFEQVRAHLGGVTGSCGKSRFGPGLPFRQGSHPASRDPVSLLGCSSAGDMWMWRASLSGSSSGWLALSTTVASSHLMEC